MAKATSPVKKTLLLGIPLLAGNFSFYLQQLADTVMVGRLGTDSLAAIAMAGLYTGILFTFIWPIMVGTQAVAARRYGKQKAGRVTDENGLSVKTGVSLDNGIVLGFSMGLLAVVFSFTAEPVLKFLIKDPDLLPLSLRYVSVIRWILPLDAVVMAMSGFLGGINRTGSIMVSNVGGNILNVIFNYLLIFGKFGFSPMGIGGAAAGTVLAGLCQLIYLTAVIKLDKKVSEYRTMSFRTIDIKVISSMFRVLFPLAVQNSIALAVFLIYESVVGSIGTVYLAATHVIFSLFRINKTVVGGFARGSSILVGNSLGAEKPEEAFNYIVACQKIAGFIGVVVLALVLLFPEYIMRLFVQDETTIEIGIKALYFFAVFFFIEVMGYSFELIFGGIGWGRYVLFSEFSTNMVFIIGLTFLLVRVLGMGIYAAWTGFAVYQVGHALILFAGFISRKWLDIKVEKDGE